jgi:hypothetical protein
MGALFSKRKIKLPIKKKHRKPKLFETDMRNVRIRVLQGENITPKFSYTYKGVPGGWYI